MDGPLLAPVHAQAWMITSVIVNLGMLGYFK